MYILYSLCKMPSYITLEKKVVELQQANETPENLQPKIQRVPEHLRKRSNYDKYYSPKLVSIGPIHHGKANLKSGEKYKLMCAEKYIKRTSQTPENLLKKFVVYIDELMDLFTDDILTLTRESQNGFRSLEEKLSWMLFVDGCFLLYILMYNWDDMPLNIKFDQLILAMMDALLLENQLPYLVLKLLWINDNETELIETMKNFLDQVDQTVRIYPKQNPSDINQDNCFCIRKNKEKEVEDSVGVLIPNESEEPIHLLDLWRKIMLTKSSSEPEGKPISAEDITGTRIKYKNIQDLRAAGIRLKPSRTAKLSDVHFSKGWFAAKLSLPMLIMDNNTATTFLNLIAYETCPDFENDYGVSSFAYFMDSLIDCPKDVKELRSSGILIDSDGTDEDVANLFNIIGADLITNYEKYFDVRSKMNDHYQNIWKTWIALGIHTYFSNPWAFIAFLAAFIALALTFIQTWFTIHPTC